MQVHIAFLVPRDAHLHLAGSHRDDVDRRGLICPDARGAQADPVVQAESLVGDALGQRQEQVNSGDGGGESHLVIARDPLHRYENVGEGGGARDVHLRAAAGDHRSGTGDRRPSDRRRRPAGCH